MKKILFIIIACLCLQNADATTVIHPSINDEASVVDIVHYVNKYRISHGLPALILNPIISKEAKIHSLDMAKHRIPFGHDHFNARIQRLFKQVTPNVKSGAENVAYNYKDIQELVRQWIKSPGHRRNIVGNYRLTGVGIARDEQGKKYYTQIFLR